jgi:hypothetical protein
MDFANDRSEVRPMLVDERPGIDDGDRHLDHREDASGPCREIRVPCPTARLAIPPDSDQARCGMSGPEDALLGNKVPTLLIIGSRSLCLARSSTIRACIGGALDGGWRRYAGGRRRGYSRCSTPAQLPPAGHSLAGSR